VSITQISKFQVRRGQEKTTGIPQLSPGEFGWAEDTEHLYIGKRISEGANTDANSRVLTEKDLDNFFQLLVDASGANTATVYKYKFDDVAVNKKSEVRSVQSKLDDFVNVLDFVPGGLTSSLDYANLQTAVETIFANTVTNQRKILRLPAGTYNIDATVFIPAYTTLIGEGPDVTVLVSTNSVPIFQTVGNQPEDNGQIDITSLTNQFPMSRITEATQPKNIHIEGMTLKCQDAVNFDQFPLLSLDNVKNANIINVDFGDALSNATISTGTAIQIRGNSANGTSVAFSNNITVDQCLFQSIGTAIHQSTGTTNQFTIQNSQFSKLGNRGIEMWGAVPGADGPRYGTIHNNRFDRITKEAIYIGTLTNKSSSYVVTSNNVFASSVAHTFTSTAIMAFNDDGNVSNNDRFEIYDDYNTPGYSGYHNALVSGNAKVDIGYTRDIVISTNTNYTNVLKIPLTRTQQMATITYKLSNTSMSRSGTLTMNTSPNTDGTWYSSVSDQYTYSEKDANSSLNLTFSTNFDYSNSGNYVSLTCLNQTDPASATAATTTVFEYQITLLV
jgi:hypothetical protein